MSFRIYAYALLCLMLFSCSSGNSEEASSHTPSVDDPVYFVDVAADVGLGDFLHTTGAVGDKWYPEPMGSGGGFIDYDGDGWEDILLASGGTWEGASSPNTQGLWLYRNNQDGTFTQVTQEAGLAEVLAYTIGINVADYDNDGDDDFFLSNLRTNMLFRNDGGVFTEVGEQAGIADEAVWSSSTMFFDANKDGWLDLYVGNYVEWSPETDIFCPPGGTVKLYCIPAAYTGIPSRFFMSNGDGTFTDVTESAGFYPALGKSLGVSELDFNNDGWPDLAVANDGEGDLLYRNNQDGTFSELGTKSGMAFSEHGEARAGMGIDAGVVDSSGEVSVVVGNFSEEMVGVYKYVGNESFIDRSASSKIGYPSLLILTFGVILFDADYDTDLDVFLANGHVYPDRTSDKDKVTYRQPSQLYMNRGNGVFDLLETDKGVLAERMVARGVAYADYDKDGDLDLLLTENEGPVHLWRNEKDTGSVLRVKARGKEDNRDAISTEIVAYVDGLAMHRRVRTGSSYLSSSEKTVTFGLGNHISVDSLSVRWPNGASMKLYELDKNQEILVVQGEDGYTKTASFGNGAES
ncbi:MAG: CRTAC1 family protein [Rhodothermaceae bacterium]|nr:CRTAC1 family protein [Rhodothermaceae bacterium]